MARRTHPGIAFHRPPATASAQSPEEDEDFTLRINGDVTIAEGETVNSVVVIDGDLTVEGEVTDFALVIDGDAIVSGSVGEDLTVISGDTASRRG